MFYNKFFSLSTVKETLRERNPKHFRVALLKELASDPLSILTHCVRYVRVSFPVYFRYT